MKITIRKEQIGRIEINVITAINIPIDKSNKAIVESKLHDYVRGTLYPNMGLNIYHSEHDDTASIVVIKELNDMSASNIDI